MQFKHQQSWINRHLGSNVRWYCTYDNGTAGVGATLTISGDTLTAIDGVTLTAGDRIVIKDEASLPNNGIYTYTSTTVLTRATDFDTPTEMAGGDFVFVQQGTSK